MALNPTDAVILLSALSGRVAPEVNRLTYEAQMRLVKLLKQFHGEWINKAIADDTDPFRFVTRIRRAKEIVLRQNA